MGAEESRTEKELRCVGRMNQVPLMNATIMNCKDKYIMVEEECNTKKIIEMTISSLG